MPKGRRFSAEQIITKLREAEILLSQGKSVEEAARVLEIASQTYYRRTRVILIFPSQASCLRLVNRRVYSEFDSGQSDPDYKVPACFTEKMVQSFILTITKPPIYSLYNEM